FIVVLVATVGCANMTSRQQRALSGGAAGAAGGAALGAVTGGSPGVGAAVGGAAGATTGYFWDCLFGPEALTSAEEASGISAAAGRARPQSGAKRFVGEKCSQAHRREACSMEISERLLVEA